MKEVVDQIKELYELLETKLKTTELLNKKLSGERQEIEKIKAKTIQTLKHASAKERVFQKYVDFDNSVKEFGASKEDYDKRIKEAKVREENDEAMLKKMRKRMML